MYTAWLYNITDLTFIHGIWKCLPRYINYLANINIFFLFLLTMVIPFKNTDLQDIQVNCILFHAEMIKNNTSVQNYIQGNFGIRFYSRSDHYSKLPLTRYYLILFNYILLETF